MCDGDLTAVNTIIKINNLKFKITMINKFKQEFNKYNIKTT